MMTTINHMTWGDPSQDELKQLNAQMLLKAVRVLLSILILSGYVIGIVLLRFLNLSSNMIIGLTIVACLPVLIYYWAYRNPLVFGRRLALREEIETTATIRYFWFAINLLVLCPLLLVFADKMMAIGCVLIAFMAISTYWKELFMFMLFVMKKYTVKDGDVFYHQILQDFHSAYRAGVWFSLVYLLDFEDSAGRKIPVMVDRHTYRKFKNKSEALIIKYEYKDSYLFEIIKLG